MLLFKLSLLLIFAQLAVEPIDALELRALQSIFSFLGGGDLFAASTNKTKDISQMTLAELGQSQGECDYDFLDYITYRYRRECACHEKSIAHLLSKSRNIPAAPKPPIMVKCLQQVPESMANTTNTNVTMQIISSVKDVVTLLKPIGNATKRHEEGSCVLILFFTESSLGCSLIAPYINILPYLFPTLSIAAIDAYTFPSFNTEFGIVGLPTLLLFHQGRPIVKFYSHEGTYSRFVTRHTGIQPVPATADMENVKGPLPLMPVQKTDYYLIMAWSFILLCLGNYFAKTRMCLQFVEMIKRNWRESEAQLEHS